MNLPSHKSWVANLLVVALGWGTPAFAQTGQEDISLRTNPAKITFPMIEEKKAASANLEGKLLDDEISQLTELIQNTPEGPSRADLLFRLSERYYDKYHSLHYREMQEYDKVIQNWMEEREKNPNAPEPIIDNSKSQASIKQAVEVSLTLLSRYKEYPRWDEVIFTTAYNLYEGGDKQEGLKMYWELIKKHPSSRFLPDALLATGEHYFAANDVSSAKKAYARALKYTDSKVYPYALYKLAWCDYKVGDYPKAIEKLKQVVKYADQQMQPMSGNASNKTNLKHEAFKDLALFFSHIDAMDSAKEYFIKQVGEKSAFEYLRILSLSYEHQAKYEMAIKSFRYLLNDYPTQSDCPSFQRSIVFGYRKLKKRDDVKREVNRLIEQYKPGSVWAEVNKDNKPALQKASALVEESLSNLVAGSLQEARGAKSWDTFNLAREMHAKYLSSFPNSESANRRRWDYADILYKMGDFYAAADEYSRIVQQDPKGAYASEASYNAVLCWDKCIIQREKDIDCTKYNTISGNRRLNPEESRNFIVDKRDFSQLLSKADLVKQEVPFLEKKFLEATEIFTSVAPTHEMYVPVLIRRAFVFYQYRHILEALNKKEPLELAKRFKQFVDTYPASKYAHDALYAAMVIFNDAKQFDVASNCGKQLLNKYPSSDHIDSVFALLAVLCERIADFGSAATYHEMYFEKWLAKNRGGKLTTLHNAKDSQDRFDDFEIENKRAREALKYSALLRENMGEYAGAINNYVKYIKYFHKASDSADQLYRVGTIYERLGKWRDADHIWEGYLERYTERSSPARVLDVTYKHALALHHGGKQKESGKFIDKVLELYFQLTDQMRIPEARHAVSHARFLQLEPEFNSFMDFKLVLPQNVFKHNLFVKIDTRSKLEKKYEEVVALQDPDWSLAALVRLGQINQNLSQSMCEAPIPHDLTPTQQDAYTQELQKQALPFEEKATAYYQKSIAISASKAIYNEWVLRAQDLLHIYQPNTFPEPYKADLAATEIVHGLWPIINPMHRDVFLDLGSFLMEETLYFDAIEIYKNALHAFPGDKSIMNNLMVCYRLNRQYQEAEAIGYQLLAKASNNLEAYNNLVLIFYYQSKYEMAELMAVTAIGKLEQQRRDQSMSEAAGIHNNLGLVYLKSGRVRDAQQQFSGALEINSDQIDALINTGAIAHLYRDYSRAQAAYEKALELDPENDKALRGLAYAMLGKGDAQLSITLMNKVLARNPDYIHAYYALGVVHETLLHDFPSAITYYEQYIAKMGFALASDDPVKRRLATAKAKLEATGTAKSHTLLKDDRE